MNHLINRLFILFLLFVNDHTQLSIANIIHLLWLINGMAFGASGISCHQVLLVRPFTKLLRGEKKSYQLVKGFVELLFKEVEKVLLIYYAS